MYCHIFSHVSSGMGKPPLLTCHHPAALEAVETEGADADSPLGPSPSELVPDIILTASPFTSCHGNNVVHNGLLVKYCLRRVKGIENYVLVVEWRSVSVLLHH